MEREGLYVRHHVRTPGSAFVSRRRVLGVVGAFAATAAMPRLFADAAGGVNVGVFDPTAFGRARPRELETWHCTASRAGVELVKRDYFGRAVHRFERAQFLVADALPAPAT